MLCSIIAIMGCSLMSFVLFTILFIFFCFSFVGKHLKLPELKQIYRKSNKNKKNHPKNWTLVTQRKTNANKQNLNCPLNTLTFSQSFIQSFIQSVIHLFLQSISLLVSQSVGYSFLFFFYLKDNSGCWTVRISLKPFCCWWPINPFSQPKNGHTLEMVRPASNNQ